MGYRGLTERRGVAYPFGGHPRLCEYLAWAKEEHGCTFLSGYSRSKGKVETFVQIENPNNGKHVIFFGGMKEYLLANQVANLDRRLGIDSPFAKLVGYNDND